MDFVKREDQNVVDEQNYKLYLESLQKSQQMEAEYQHTALSIEQLHQAMQSSLSSSIAHNFQLSPRQMSTLMLKSNLSRNFNEIPAHLPRNLSSDMDMVQNLGHDLTLNLRHDDMLLGRNLDLSLRNLNNDLESNLIQNLSEQDMSRINNDLNKIEIEVLPHNELPHNLSHEMDLSHHLNRQTMGQDILNDQRRTMIHMQENQLLEQNMTGSLNPRVGNIGVSVPSISLHDNPRLIGQNEHTLPMPFNIKSEQEDENYFYDNMNVGTSNVLNGHLPVQTEQQANQTVHQDTQMYLYNNHIQNLPGLNPIDLYSRPQYIQNIHPRDSPQNFQTRENPQNLVIQKQFESYNEDLKKYRTEDESQNSNVQKLQSESKEQPKENLKPLNQNKIYYPEFNNQSVFVNENKNENIDNKLTISEDPSLIKGEYYCYKCQNIFPTKRGLKHHARSCMEDGETPSEKEGKYACSQCTYRCQSPAILKIHERTHNGIKPFSCTFCDYKSGQKNNVAKHILVHMKEKPFRCQYCEYRCAQKNNLVVHERTHTGYKPFACPFCDYRTVQKPNLVKHMYLHTDQKPFSCDMCNYRCVQKTNLTKHKQRHLNEKDGEKIDGKICQKPYRPRQKSVKCPHCTYRCVQKSSLEKHMQFKHSGSTAENCEFNENLTEKVNYEYAPKDFNPLNDKFDNENHKNSVSDSISDSEVSKNNLESDKNVPVVIERPEVCDESINLSVKKDFECSVALKS